LYTQEAQLHSLYVINQGRQCVVEDLVWAMQGTVMYEKPQEKRLVNYGLRIAVTISLLMSLILQEREKQHLADSGGRMPHPPYKNP